MRSEFEKLPSISVFLPSFKFNEAKNEYERSENFNQPEYTLGFFNGAWYAYQHQQSKVDELQLKLSEDSRILHNVIEIERKKNDELQKRCDELALSQMETASHNAKLQKRVDDLNELNRLKTIALQQSVNRTSAYVHEKIVALEQALKGGEA